MAFFFPLTGFLQKLNGNLQLMPSEEILTRKGFMKEEYTPGMVIMLETLQRNHVAR